MFIPLPLILFFFLALWLEERQERAQWKRNADIEARYWRQVNAKYDAPAPVPAPRPGLSDKGKAALIGGSYLLVWVLLFGVWILGY